MRTWYFSEMAYHPAWDKGLARGSLRVNFPSENLDPQEAGTLLNRYLDEFVWRWNRRRSFAAAFDGLLGIAVTLRHASRQDFVAQLA